MRTRMGWRGMDSGVHPSGGGRLFTVFQPLGRGRAPVAVLPSLESMTGAALVRSSGCPLGRH